jgi:hypothetical protein
VLHRWRVSAALVVEREGVGFDDEAHPAARRMRSISYCVPPRSRRDPVEKHLKRPRLRRSAGAVFAALRDPEPQDR